MLQGVLDWIYPTLESDQCQVLVDTIMHLHALHTLWEIPWLTEEEGLCSMELVARQFFQYLSNREFFINITTEPTVLTANNLISAYHWLRPDRLCGPPSLLYNAYRVFPGGKVWQVRAADHSRTQHAVPMPRPCRAADGLECVFLIWFTQGGLVWFTFAMPCPCSENAVFSRPQHSTAISRRPCCAVALRRTAWSEHGLGMSW